MNTRRCALPYFAIALGLVLIVGFAYGVPAQAGDGLDDEGNLWAGLSGLLLGLAAIATFGLSLALDGGRRIAAMLYSALLGLLALDEVFVLHERLERLSGIDWQILYAPVFLVGGIGGLILMLSIPRSSAAVMFAGGLCWVVSQGLEKVQWSGDVLVHRGLVLPEELLEATGSVLFATAILMAGMIGRRVES